MYRHARMDLTSEFIDNHLNQYWKNYIKKMELFVLQNTYEKHTPRTDGATINKYELTKDRWF